MSPTEINKHIFKSPKLASVVNDAVEFFKTTPTETLPPQDKVSGGGVYAIYYLGKLSLYRKLAKLNTPDLTIPIYVGKAVPTGWRTARPGGAEGSVVGLLTEHSRSIKQTENLSLEDFRSKFMILSGIESDLIAPVEAALIRFYTPIWNSVISGFGIHAPGSGRADQKISEWDVLHPGRSFVGKMSGASTNVELATKKINGYLKNLKIP